MPRSIVVFKKLIAAQMVNKFPACYETLFKIHFSVVIPSKVKAYVNVLCDFHYFQGDYSSIDCPSEKLPVNLSSLISKEFYY